MLINYFLAFFITIIININGLIKIITGDSIVAGQYSPFVAPAVFILILLLLLVNNNIIASYLHFKKNIHVFVSAVVCLFIFGVKSGNYITSLKDLVYTFLIISFYYFILFLDKKRLFHQVYFVKALIIFGGGIFPLIGYLLFETEERFGGLVLSNPLFGNMYVIFSLMILALSSINKFVPSILLIVFLFPTILSGSRSAVYLIIVLLLFLNWRTLFINTYYLKVSRVIISIFILSIIITSFELLFSTGFRVFSFTDIVYGSINTRYVWYYKLLLVIKESYFFGGFGAGSSKNFIGYIPHFDFLRYWYDYSILYPILFFIILFNINKYIKIKDCTFYYRVLTYFSFFIMIILSMHNIFQDPGFVLLITSYVYILNSNNFTSKTFEFKKIPRAYYS